MKQQQQMQVLDLQNPDLKQNSPRNQFQQSKSSFNRTSDFYSTINKPNNNTKPNNSYQQFKVMFNLPFIIKEKDYIDRKNTIDVFKRKKINNESNNTSDKNKLQKIQNQKQDDKFGKIFINELWSEKFHKLVLKESKIQDVVDKINRLHRRQVQQYIEEIKASNNNHKQQQQNNSVDTNNATIHNEKLLKNSIISANSSHYQTKSSMFFNHLSSVQTNAPAEIQADILQELADKPNLDDYQDQEQKHAKKSNLFLIRKKNLRELQNYKSSINLILNQCTPFQNTSSYKLQ